MDAYTASVKVRRGAVFIGGTFRGTRVRPKLSGGPKSVSGGGVMKGKLCVFQNIGIVVDGYAQVISRVRLNRSSKLSGGFFGIIRGCFMKHKLYVFQKIGIVIHGSFQNLEGPSKTLKGPSKCVQNDTILNGVLRVVPKVRVYRNSNRWVVLKL